MDVTSFLSAFVALMVQGVGDCLNILDTISFNGISLLWYIVSIALIGIFLPVLLTLTKSKRVRGRSNTRSKGSSDED